MREHSRIFTVASDIQGTLERGNVVTDPRAPEAVFQAITNPEAIDDRKGLFTGGLAAITKLPSGKLQDDLNDKVMTVLYETLTHPPATFIDDEYQFRKADGSGNNITIPQLGQSGRPYARSVQRKHPLPANMLPDAGLVFDTLLRARDVSWIFIMTLCSRLIKACSSNPTQAETRLSRSPLRPSSPTLSSGLTQQTGLKITLRPISTSRLSMARTRSNRTWFATKHRVGDFSTPIRFLRTGFSSYHPQRALFL